MSDNPTPTTPTGRNPDGTFAAGNPGGPGRPRRATEQAYLTALSDTLTLEEWRAIVARAVQDAKNGDGKAREWLAQYALGAEPLTLTQLAALEYLSVTEEHMVRAEAKYQTGGPLKNITHETPIERAHSLKELDDSKEKAEQELAARARRRAEKQAAKQAAESAGVNDA
jgi:hypothetical protein